MAGFNVATVSDLHENKLLPLTSLLLTRVIVIRGFVHDETIWAANWVRNAGTWCSTRTYDFLGRRIAVEMSLGPGWGGAPLGSAMVGDDGLEELAVAAVYKAQEGTRVRVVGGWPNKAKLI